MKKRFKTILRKTFPFLACCMVIISLVGVVFVSADDSCSCDYDSLSYFEVTDEYDYTTASSSFAPIITPQIAIGYSVFYEVWNGIEEPPNLYSPPNFETPPNPYFPYDPSQVPWFVRFGDYDYQPIVKNFTFSPDDVGEPFERYHYDFESINLQDDFFELSLSQSMSHVVRGVGDSNYNDVSSYDYYYDFSMEVYDFQTPLNFSTGEFGYNYGFGYYYSLVYNNIVFNPNEDVFSYTDSNGIYAHITFVDPALSNKPITLTSYGSYDDPTLFDLGQILTDYYHLYGDTNDDGEIILPDNVFINTIQFLYESDSLTLSPYPYETASIGVNISTSLIERNRTAWFVTSSEWRLPFFESIYNVVRDLALKVYKSSFELFSTDYVGWLVTAVGGFFSLEFAPFITIGSILSIIIMMSLVIAFLKVFMGG